MLEIVIFYMLSNRANKYGEGRNHHAENSQERRDK